MSEEETQEKKPMVRTLTVANSRAQSLAHEQHRRPKKSLAEMTLAELRKAMAAHHLRFMVHPPIKREKTVAAIWLAVQACAEGDFDRRIPFPVRTKGKSQNERDRLKKLALREADEVVTDLNLFDFVEALAALQEKKVKLGMKAKATLSKARRKLGLDKTLPGPPE